MARSQTVKASTIKNDPFADLIPDRNGEQANEDVAPGEAKPQPTQEPEHVAGSKKEKITVHLTHDLIERVKNAAYWNPELTIAGIAEIGVLYAIEKVEQENGGPYPPRKSELKGGRPIRS